MKVLCATDFSKSSVNAINWIFEYLKDIEGGEMEIIHCVDSIRRADMFVSIDDLLEEKAVEDMTVLEKNYIDSHDKVFVKSSVFKANTKTYIPKYAKKENFDLIVTGTVGLTSLKDITVGSVTDHLANHSDIPLLTIPSGAEYDGIKNVVIGLAKDEMSSAEHLSSLYSFLETPNPRIFLTQVLDKDKHTISVDMRVEEYLKDLTYEYTTLEKEESITNTLNKFCNKVSADVLCMIHYRRHWLGRLIHKSITKEELFVIQKPLLIIPD